MQMLLWSGVLLPVLLLAAFLFVRRRERPSGQLVTGPAAAAVILLAARWSGRSWSSLGLTGRGGGWALTGVALTALVYATLLLVPAGRRLFGDTRYRTGPGKALCTALVAVPLATVAVEEAAFRGALWPVVSPVLFGLWHVVPGSRTNAAVGGRFAVLATFAFTTAAGVLLTLLRHFSGGLLAPFAVHWAVNGLGVLATAAAARWDRRP